MNKLKKLLACVLGGVLLSGSMPVFADSSDNTFTDNTLTYERVEGGVEIIKADTGVTKLIIPDNISGYPILGIGESAFAGCTGLKSVEIRSGMTHIGSGAFSGCTALETVSLPDTLTTIADGAFYNCAALKTLTVPDSVTQIGTYAFANCYSLKYLALSSSVSILPAYLFYYDVMLEEVVLPEGIAQISSMCFASCYSLRTLHLPASVTDFAPMAAISCTGLQEITVDPDNPNFTTAETNALLNADGTELMLYAAGDPAESYTVPEQISVIQAYAFSGSLNLTEVILPENIAEIGEGAFADCRRLTRFTFPPQLTAIPGSIFADCESLTEFTIPETVTEIGDYAFFRCGGLTGIDIPETVTSVGEYAFCGCTAIPEITVPKTVETIGDYAFGFMIDDAEESGGSPVLQPDFLLHVIADSPAKAYASVSGVKFKQSGFDSGVMLSVIISAAAILVIAAAVLLSSRRKKAAAQEQPAETDPNYEGILSEEDAGDPYDRSYGFADADNEEEEDAE